MNDLGSIVATYVITFGSIVSLVALTIQRGRKLSRQVADQDKPWI